ncbi:MAG TPA: phosphate ABC transporter substrate-binding protein PstS [Gaiellaceae bacterium]|jgi:phosphate transport system substrate-binding protein
MRNRYIAIVMAVCAVAASVIAASASASSAKQSGGQLVGAGSTFVAPLVSQWQAAYPSVSGGTNIVYQPIGSGGGIQAITNRTVDFGASDAPLSADQFSNCKGCYQIPWALGGTAVMINLKTNSHKPLRITGPVLAKIYLGQITKWNDSAIQALNPGVSLPGTAITPVYRSDGSGTSYNFVDYLSSVSATFKSEIGVSTQPPFKVGVGGKGSSGVSGVVKNTPGAIGYADIAYAITNHIQVMAVRNAAGKYETPGIKSIAAAAAAYKTVPSNNEMHIVNPPKTAKIAYPISTYTYVIVPESTGNAVPLRKFIFWALTPRGQAYGVKLRYVPIPKAILVASERTLAKVHS